MAWIALSVYVAFLVLAFGVRVVLHLRRTGRSGLHGPSGSPGSTEWLAGVLFVVALVLGAAAPVLDLTGSLEPLEPLDGTAGHVAGIVLAGAGVLVTFAAQGAMGASWRIGVDERERTELVTGGPFALVRNPIYAAMIPTSVGLALLVPNVLALVAVAALALALELQTRLVEEPHLLESHGSSYADYAARVGRFVPGVGRLRT